MYRILVALAISVAGCTLRPQADTAAETERIRALDHDWARAAAARDFDALAAIYAADARQLNPNMPAVVGRDSIRALFQGLHARFPRFAHQFEMETITVAQSGDLAVVTGTYRFVPDSLQPGIEDVGKFVGVWKREQGDWRLALDVSNSDRPPRP